MEWILWYFNMKGADYYETRPPVCLAIEIREIFHSHVLTATVLVNTYSLSTRSTTIEM